ncbi:MAG: 4-amino-4-deoxy-L-arabinose transferase-like glycosyltransferase of family [Chthonomonadaceae bacterium]|nr:4-amino-4-deoxy-L-arabinose transferase-like glycosyltransferase of family [Chthonomonadaceae bacterium]
MVSESQSEQSIRVNEVEKGSVPSPPASRNWLLTFTLILGPLLLLALYSKIVYAGLISSDALDFAQIGRNISAGHGMVTYVLRPLALTHGSNVLRQPDVTHGPLFPFLLAFAFGAVGARDAVASGVSGLFYLLTVPLLYALGQRVFNRTVGMIAAAAFAFSGLTLQYAVSGLPITLYTFLITALFLALYNLASGKTGQAVSSEAPLPTMLLLLIGVLTGLLYLTDAVFIWVVPVIIVSVVAICGPKRRMSVIKFLVPLGVLMLPWMARNFILTGNPVFGMRGVELWMGTDHHFPGNMAYSLYSEEFPRGAYMLSAVFKKILSGMNSVVRTLPMISDAWILAFLMPCLLFGYTSRAATLLRRTVIFSAIALLVGMLLFRVEMTLFTCLVPAMLVFSVAYLTHLFRQAQLSPSSTWLVSGLLGITIFYPVISQMFLEEKMYGIPEASAAKALGKMMQPQEAILSDRPEVAAWYADHPAIQIPAIDDRVADIRSQFPTTRWLFLTPSARSQSAPWQALYEKCARWNAVYAEAQRTNMDVPAVIQIPATNQPLFKDLSGFTSVAPEQDSSPSAVIAVLPDPKVSLHSEAGLTPTP